MKALYSDELRELRSQGTRVHSLKPQGHDSRKPVKDVNSLLRDLYVRDKPLRDEHFPRYFKVFQAVSLRLHELIKQVDAYCDRYSVARFEGRRDRLRIDKPDDFDMEIVIGIPMTVTHENPDDSNNPAKSDVAMNPANPEKNVVIEDIESGFVRLKVGTRNLHNKDEEDLEIIQTAYGWLNQDNYLIRSLFVDWFKSVVDKAMNFFEVMEDNLPFATHIIRVEGHPYSLRLDATCTLVVENAQDRFRMDVDLVPALEFLGNDCRRMPSKLKKKMNYVVMPKPMQGGAGDVDRSWRLPLKLQEWDLLYMKQIIRMIKKLRDCQSMNKITSYCIKTIFYHEAMAQERDPEFWSRNGPAELFKHMVKKFHLFLENKNIPYFWNADINLIRKIEESTLDEYAKKLKRIINVLEDPSEYKKVAKFLLSESQFKEYKKKILNI